MQIELFRPVRPWPVSQDEGLPVNGGLVPLRFVRNPRARRYVLRVDQDGAARVTVPRAGSYAEARRFAERQTGWIERQLVRRAAELRQPRDWRPGSEIFFRGEREQLTVVPAADGVEVRFGDQVVPATRLESDLRPMVERHLRTLATCELPERVMALAAQHHFPVRRVQVRNQRSRWGSCSRCGTVSLNWRLVQTPPFVRDYIILHELAHLRHMNHSARFWNEVERICPHCEQAERWLKRWGKELLQH
jgi:hypothetical protein